MANSKRKCKLCKEYTTDFIKTNAGVFCCFDHAIEWGKQKADRDRIKAAEKTRKEVKQKDRQKLKELRSRSWWFSKLQILVNQYVVHVLEKGKPCYTCGTTKPDIKYDAGHRHHAGRGGGDRRRFLHVNIKKQCSVNCNQHGSGMPKEYDIALDKEYGEGFAEYLACESNYPTLKEQFPTWQDIENEIKRYRELIRAKGLKPKY